MKKSDCNFILFFYYKTKLKYKNIILYYYINNKI